MEWQPIKSAPKDAVIWAYNGEQVRMKWMEWAGIALWIYDDELLADVDPEPEQPTHWMPMPLPPIDGTQTDEPSALEASANNEVVNK